MLPHPPVHAVILAAGGSTRMGQPKGLLDVDGVPLAWCHAAGFLGAGLPVTIVLGAHEAAYRAALRPWMATEPLPVRLVVNPAWATTTPADSLRLAHAAGAAIVTPVDVPPARPSTTRALLREPADAVAGFDGARGHPVRLASPLLPGERMDTRLARAPVVLVDDPTCLLNLNTPSAWRAWLHARQGGTP